VANLLRLFKIPQVRIDPFLAVVTLEGVEIIVSHLLSISKKVSFFSSSPELSNKQRFEYFTRTIPSDHHQVMAIVQMIRFLKWSYISILYEESTYGIKVKYF
jgi:metabotropic X receptor